MGRSAILELLSRNWLHCPWQSFESFMANNHRIYSIRWSIHVNNVEHLLASDTRGRFDITYRNIQFYADEERKVVNRCIRGPSNFDELLDISLVECPSHGRVFVILHDNSTSL